MKDNKKIIEDFIDATNQHNWTKVESLVHENFVRHSSSEPKEIKTRKGLIDFHKQELKVFPDLFEKILFIIQEGDLIAARINFYGTQLGQLGIFPPSNKTLNADFNCFFRVLDGKIIESWVEYDNLNGLIQLGHYRID